MKKISFNLIGVKDALSLDYLGNKSNNSTSINIADNIKNFILSEIASPISSSNRYLQTENAYELDITWNKQLRSEFIKYFEEISKHVSITCIDSDGTSGILSSIYAVCNYNVGFVHVPHTKLRGYLIINPQITNIANTL